MKWTLQKKREYSKQRNQLITAGKWHPRSRRDGGRVRSALATDASLKFQRTGDFWIDLGIVCLWKQFSSVANSVSQIEGGVLATDKNLTVKLTEDYVEVKTTSAKELCEFIQKQFDILHDRYWIRTKKGKQWWSPLANYYFAHLNGPNKLLINPLKLTKAQKTKWRKGDCDFCNRIDVDAKIAGTTEHPFLVVPNRMTNFYSNLRGRFRICLACTLATKFALGGLFFTIDIKEGRLLAFCFESSSLLHLDRAYGVLSRLLIEGDPNKNFKSLPTQFPAETFAIYLVELQQELDRRSQVDLDLLKQLNVVHIFSLTRAGKTTSIDRYYVMPNLPRLFDLARQCQWSSDERTYNALAELLRIMYFRHGNKFDTSLRELFCSALINFNSISGILEDFIYE